MAIKQEVRVVERNSDGMLKCEVECSEACGSCSAKKICGTQSSKKTITLFDTLGNIEQGNTLVVEIASTVGLKAVLLAYLLPIVLLIAAIFVLQELGYSELTAGLWGLGSLVLYFILVAIFKIGKGIAIDIIQKK
ncbi:MAG: SoxR reducing system RseC family protein [Rikenellaceae bacterium]